MEVEFIARFPKELTKAEQNDIDDQAKALMLFDGDLTLQNARSKVMEYSDSLFQYGPWTLEMNDISDFTMVDKEHTRIIKNNGMSIVFLIPYPNFKMIKQFTTGKMTANHLDFMMPIIQEPKTKKKKND